MKTLVKGLILATFLALVVGAAPALAASPILSASYQGNSSLQISISNANSFSPINLYTRQSSSLWTTVSNIGQTDGNGNFNQVISMPGDGSSNPLQLYVTVGGLQSSTISVYPNGGSNNNCTYYNNCSVGGLTLSQTSLSLSSGQTAYVTASSGIYNGYSNNLYISSNSNSSVASASVSGNSVTVYGINSGSTNISVCANSGSSVCATLFVTVNGNGGSNCTYNNNCNTGGLVLSQSSLILSQGQSSTVSITSNVYGGNTYISSNSNSSVASASVSGNIIYVNAISSGNTNISICQNSGSGCATLYVTVSGSGCYSTNCGSGGSVSLSQSSLNINVGQSSTVTIYGGGSYYISNNSNSAVTSASISGNLLYLSAIGNGNSTVTVCQSNGGYQCATLYVTVSGFGGNSSISFSQNNVNLALAQNMSVNIFGSIAGSYYISSNSNSAVATASISGSTLYLYGVGNGSTNISVCQSGYSGCATLYITVGNNNCGLYNNCGGNGVISLSQTSLSLSQGQSSAVTVYGGTPYISSNGTPSVASATVSGNTIYISAISSGSTNISVCSNSGASGCAILYVTVNGGSSNCYYSYSNCGTGSGSLSLSQTSLSLISGQSSSVTIYGSGNYYISSNSNSSVVSASVSGNILYVSPIGSGSSSISVCQSSFSSCVTLFVTVNNGSYGGSTVSLSQTSLTLSQGQTSTVNIFGGGGFGYFVSSNSNPGVAVVSQSGSVLSVYGSQSGSSTIQVCQNSANACATLYVTVGGGTGTGCYSNCGGVTYPGGGVLGASTYQNGQLLSENGTVYIVYKNLQSPFASAFAFTGLGFSFSNVLNAGATSLTASGYTVTTPYAQHPWGSWIKSGQTVYFVHQSGLIPVPNWTTFLNNGGQASWIVPANSYDFALPIMAPMTNNDSRLQ